MSEWKQERKIAHIGEHVKRDAVVTLAQSLEKATAGKIKSVMVSIQWDDDTLSCDFSQMPRSALVSHAFNCQAEAHKAITITNEGK